MIYLIFGNITLIVSICLFIINIIFIPKLKFWVFPLIGSILLLIFGILPLDLVFNELTKPGLINPIEILILFISMTFISTSLDELGLFKFLASYALSKAKSKQIILFLIVYGLTSVLTIFTSNDIIILTFTPFIIFFCKNVHINPIPYLFSEFVAANTWSMMFIIGNPTNIYLASYNAIDFFSYFKIMVLPTIACSLTSLIFLFLIFFKQLKKPLEIKETKIHHINQKAELFICLSVLVICIMMLIIQPLINIKMYLITLGSAIIVFVTLLISWVIRKKDNLLIKAFCGCPFDLIPFVISMFILTLYMKEYHITDYFFNILGNKAIIFRYGFSALFSCNIINNIPMSVMYANIISFTNHLLLNKALFATVMASNIGAFLTPIGALAGIMWLKILKKNEVKFSFLDFIKHGLIIAIPTLLVGLVVLEIIL